MELETVEAKRMRLDENLRAVRIQNEKLDLKIYQNHLKTQCIEDNYINKLLDSTRTLIQNTEEFLVESRAISTAINTFGLRSKSTNIFEDETDSNGPSTSNSRSSTTPSKSSPSTSSSSSSNLPIFESTAIDEAINSFGIAKY